MTATAAPPRTRLLPMLALVPALRWAIAVHSVPADQPWRAACACGEPLWSNAVLPPGRCTGCGQRVGAAPYTVEAAATLAAIALPLSGRTGWTLAAFAWWAAGMIVLVFVDLAVMRLPHRITAITAAGFLGLLTASDDPHAWLRGVLAGLILAGCFAVLAVASRGQLGWGDVALAVPVAAALGWHSWAAVYAGTLLGFGAAAVTAITLRRMGRLADGSYLPLGPFLIAAAVALLVWWS